VFGVLEALCVGAVVAASIGDGFSPSTVVTFTEGKGVFVACSGSEEVLWWNGTNRVVSRRILLPGSPSGLALSPDRTRLFVTWGETQGRVSIVDVEQASLLGQLRVGHSPIAPVVAPDGRLLYVCNRSDHDVSVIDLAARREVRRIAVQREPVSADITRDGCFLLVANHLQNGRADADYVAAAVSVIDLGAGKVVKELALPNGSGMLNALRISPDGRHAVLTHLVAGFFRTAEQIGYGWINANALTIIDVARMEVLYTVPLDEPNSGAANPWGVAWSEDSATVVVTHSGTHEISVIDFPKLLARLPGLPAVTAATGAGAVAEVLRPRYEPLPGGAFYLVGARRRIKLPLGDLGPAQ